MAEVCLAGLGRVSLTTGAAWPGPVVLVQTDHPTAACMASQYAGWQVVHGQYFGMGSGPMRAVRGREALFDTIGHLEQATEVIGVLESAALPDQDVVQCMADECGINSPQLTLLVAPTASLAGTVQVVARSIETAMHKMHELGFDITRVTNGFGIAPLPPVASDDLTGIGRTNDAVLYGGEVTLWIDGDDDDLSRLGSQIPSSASSDAGQPFAEIFQRYERDFYKIDPLLFSPAVVTLVSNDSGRSFCFGHSSPEILRKSFATEVR